MTDEQQPKLKLIQAVADKANRFSAEKLKLSGGGSGGIVAKKVLLRVPIRKPARNEFFRVHPGPDYTLDTFCLEYDREFFVILPEMRAEMATEGKPFLIYTAVNRVGVVFLWPVRIPGEGDGFNTGWWDSSHEIAGLAKDVWLRCSANMSLGGYEAVIAEVPLPEPDWPDKTGDELWEIAFGKQFIDSPDSQVFKMIRGRA